jgi:hypothetical protein
MIKRWRQWRELRRYNGVIRQVDKLAPPTQLGLAQVLIASIAVPLTRDRRRKFLKFQTDKIEELTKSLVGDNRTGQR